MRQLGLRNLSEMQKSVGEVIIGNLDDSGYLQRDLSAMVDDLAFTQNIMVKEKEIEDVLHIIQDFDPAGVGARNLQECLKIQLDREDETEPGIALARLIIDRFFPEFTKKHYEKIMRRARIDEDELKEAIDQILKLNPKPGNSMGESSRTNQYVIPDFMIRNI